MASYSSSIQPGSLVTHPSLYANLSREELLARIAELERLQARNILDSTPQDKPAGPDATQSTLSAAPAEASSSSTTLDHPPASTSAAAHAATPVQSKHERKLLKKKARLQSPTGNDGNTGTGALQGEDFFARYGSRKIALRFCYEGWLYGGLALQNDEPPSGILPVGRSSNSSSSNTASASKLSDNALPTVEGVLLDALVASRLIKESDKRDLDKLDFSRCGRTDRGVSAAGQVISLYVRSQLREQEGSRQPGWRSAENPPMEVDTSALPEEERKKAELKKNKPRSELPYMSLLNRVLPNSIRILGWSPVDESFDARFSCRHRHYKYFFTAPPPSQGRSVTRKGRGLDIGRMQDAANRLVGEHDFRNLCKVDATKQITNFYRHVMSATVSLVSPTRSSSTTDSTYTTGTQNGLTSTQDDEDMYVFDLKGSAFLYHQVRHIMAVLFLVGSGHEEPSVIDALLNTGYPPERPLLTSASQDSTSKTLGDNYLPVVVSRPAYEMASDLPLVLWDCAFTPEANLQWRQDELIEGEDLKVSKGYLEMKQAHTQLRIKEAISSHFMRAYLETGQSSSPSAQPNGREEQESNAITKNKKANMFEIELGGGKTARAGKYTPLLERPRSDTVEVVNERWASGQGKRRAERKAREQAQVEAEMDA
ncbi:tRNA pseudouridine synthase [Cystobasidium minutum MCA 4210]|uniref:tRNA pseudouridine synthase n=1 Tax=Cystobasidium minutum MCA 4210 TaxID=1397322 RepID=UPI0034CDD7AA|eukprot:jgi/Rhomi1/169282/fgenesh1_kg.3_\